jgi:outer membrane protein OmpA-like peptidoglycan-associated protein
MRLKISGRTAAGLIALGLPLWLASCSHVPEAVNPVAWYRDISGSSQNDAKDEQSRNQKNLEAGTDKDFPNLASVPGEPNSTLSGIDRDKLQQSLIADRNNAKYSNEQLEAGQANVPGVAPPPAAVAAASPPAQQSAALPPAAANPPAPANPVQASAPPKPAAPAAQSRQNGRQEPPVESSLQTPAVRSIPQGETPPPPPPPANIVPPAVTAPVNNAAAPSSGPARQAQTNLAMRSPGVAGVGGMSVSVGDITFAAGSSSLTPAHNGPLGEIAGLYKQSGGRIRVVGHAELGSGGDPVQQQVASLDLALDRANAVAQALAQMGVPPNEISVEAAPTRGANDVARAEVFMEY